MAAAVEGMTGAQLKEQQCGQPEYAATPVHQMIGGTTEQVRERLDAALAQEGLA